MKRLIIAALLLSGITLKAQHDVSLDVLGFTFSKFGLGYEYAINSNNSVGINFNLSSKNTFHGQKSNNANYAELDGEYDYSEMNIIPEYKTFLAIDKGNDIVYIGLYGKFRTSKASGNTFTDNTELIPTFPKTDVSTTGFALGAMLGYKWKSSGALFLEVTGGIGKFLLNNVTYSNDLAEKDIDFEEEDYTPYIGNELPLDLRIAVKVGIRIGTGSKE